MKKIAIDLLPFTNRLAGTGYYVKRLLYYMQQLDKENEYYLYFGNCDDPKELFGIYATNFRIIQHRGLDRKFKRILFEQLIFPFKIYKLKPDYLFCPSVAVPVLNFSGAKIITTIHDLVPFVLKKKYSFFRNIYYNIIVRLSARKAFIILTVSENSKKDINRFLGIENSKIRILYNFLPPDIPATEDYKRENFFITVSTIQPGKNLERLFEAFSIFYSDHKDFKLYVIGGKGWKYDSVFNKVRELELEEIVIFLGYVKDEDLYKYYQKAKALVYVSLYEGFGIPPLEAIYYNCPVVVSNTSSMPEVTGQAGVQVDPYNIESIVEGMISIISEDVTSEKYSFFPIQLNKFKGEIETLKLLNIFNG